MNLVSIKIKKHSNKISIVLALFIGLSIYMMPTPEGMTIVAQKSLSIFIFCLIMWIGKPIPIYLTSIIAILLLALTGTVENQDVAFGTLGFPIIWLMVSAFVLTSAMNKTNLGNRIALWTLTKFGKTPIKMLMVLVFVNFFLAFFVPSTTARASLLVPILLVVIEIYKVVPGKSKFAKFIMLQGVNNNAFATSMIMTATSAQVIAIGFINQQTGANIGYTQWLLASAPQAILTAIISFVVGMKIFDFKKELPDKEENDKINIILTEKLKHLGPFSIKEKKATIILFLTLILWITGDYQKMWFGFEISTEQTAVLAMLLIFLPKIGVLTWKEADIKWELMLFSAGAYAAGNALNDSGGAEWIIYKLVKALNLTQLNTSIVAIILIFITIYSHLIFTSKTVRTTILIPTIISLAKGLNMDPIPLALACSLGISYTVTLPPHSKVNTLYFGTGSFTVWDELKYGLVTCFIGSSMISIVYFTWITFILK